MKNIVGSWGADLDDDNYAQAIAALGVLQARASQQYPASNDPNKILRGLLSEMEGGKHTPIWRGMSRDHGYDINYRYWATTIYTDAPALAQAWRLLLKTVEDRHSAPRLSQAAPCRGADGELEGRTTFKRDAQESPQLGAVLGQQGAQAQCDRAQQQRAWD
jgi:hypothetical protein